MTKELPLGCLQTFKNLDELNSYILDRVNHETDIIMDSEWFDEIVKRKVKATIKGMTLIPVEVNQGKSTELHLYALKEPESEKAKEEKRQNQRLLNEESWRAGYDVLTEGALGDYPEE